MAYMFPFASAVGLVAGLGAGQLAKNYAREKNWSQDAQDISAEIAHWAASSLAGAAVSNIIDPVTTIAHPATTAVAGAVYHNEIMDFMNGVARLPSTRKAY